MRRKLISSLLLFVLILSAVTGFSATNTANADDTTVYVTISNAGSIVVTQEPVKVTDVDNDGKLTINDALVLVHTAKYSSGADGYASATGDYGLYVAKLWGDTSGNFGYYVNNNMSMGAGDEVKNGDQLVAWVYVNAYPNSEHYSTFDAFEKTATAGKPVTLTLTEVTGYDPTTYAPIFGPLANATITVDGVATTVKTDAEGKATITLPSAGKAVISAVGATTIVPPVCTVTVTAAPATGVTSTIVIIVLLLAVVSLSCAIIVKKRAK